MVFEGSRSLNRVFFKSFFAVFLVCSLDRVAKLYYLILERENATFLILYIQCYRKEIKFSFSCY